MVRVFQVFLGSLEFEKLVKNDFETVAVGQCLITAKSKPST